MMQPNLLIQNRAKHITGEPFLFHFLPSGKQGGTLLLIISVLTLFIGVGPLCLCSRASLGGAVRAIWLALTLLILRILGRSTLARSVSLWLSTVALLRRVLLLAEGLLLTRPLLILGLLLAVLRVTSFIVML